MDVTVTMKDGTVREFKHRPRAGGSYDLAVKYEGAFVVIVNEYGDQTAIPAADIDQVETFATCRW